MIYLLQAVERSFFNNPAKIKNFHIESTRLWFWIPVNGAKTKKFRALKFLTLLGWVYTVVHGIIISNKLKGIIST